MVECVDVSRFLLCVVGITLSAYALHVEFSKMHNKDYKALCDISEHMSCSKVFTSKQVVNSFCIYIFSRSGVIVCQFLKFFFFEWKIELKSTFDSVTDLDTIEHHDFKKPEP